LREEGSNPAIASMVVSAVVSALLFLVAGVAWLSYVGHGMGDRYGVSGREQILDGGVRDSVDLRIGEGILRPRRES
jgi:hypothetical protein